LSCAACATSSAGTWLHPHSANPTKRGAAGVAKLAASAAARQASTAEVTSNAAKVPWWQAGRGRPARAFAGLTAAAGGTTGMMPSSLLPAGLGRFTTDTIPSSSEDDILSHKKPK